MNIIHNGVEIMLSDKEKIEKVINIILSSVKTVDNTQKISEITGHEVTKRKSINKPNGFKSYGIAELREIWRLHELGIPTKKIAAQFGRTWKAIDMQIWRLRHHSEILN